MTPEHRYRARTLPWGSSTFVLRRGALEEHPDRGPAHALPLETVVHVNLRRRFGGPVVCSVEGPDRRVTFSSRGRGPEPEREFRAFVQGIHEELGPYRTRVTWSEGSRGTHSLLRGCTLVASIAVLAALASLLSRGATPSTTQAWALGIGAIAAAGVFWPLSRSVAPAAYRPDHLPLGLGNARSIDARPIGPQPLARFGAGNRLVPKP